MAGKKTTKSAAKKAAAKKAPPAAKKAAKKKTPPKQTEESKQATSLGDEKALKGAAEGATFRPTVSHMLGEIVWLMSQSPAHRHFAVSDLDWIVAPAIAHGQYRVFRAGDKPVGVAFWAYVSEETNAKLIEGKNRIRPDEWKGGDLLWLIELIAPFSNGENKLTEAMFTDLINNPFKGKAFRFSKGNPQTGKREVAEFKPKENAET